MTTVVWLGSCNTFADKPAVSKQAVSNRQRSDLGGKKKVPHETWCNSRKLPTSTSKPRHLLRTHLFFMARARAIEVDSNRSTAITTRAVVISEEKESICPPGNHQETVIGGRPAEWQQARSNACFYPAPKHTFRLSNLQQQVGN